MGVFQVAFLHLKKIMKNKKNFFFLLIMPTVVISLAVLVLGRQDSTVKTMKINVVNQDEGVYGKELLQSFQESPDFEVEEINQQEAEKNIRENHVELAIIIPYNFSKDLESNEEPKVRILKLSNSNGDFFVQNQINRFIGKALLTSKIATITEKQLGNEQRISKGELKQRLDEALEKKNVQVKAETAVPKGKISFSGFLSIGLIIMFLMNSMDYMIHEIVDEKTNGTWRRILSTPNSNGSIAAGLLLSFLFVGWIQVIVLVTFTKLFLNMYWGSSYLALFILFTALLLVILSLAILFASFMKNKDGISGITTAFITPTCMIGGCWVPLELFPEFMKKMAYLTPQNWAVTGLEKLILQSQGIQSIALHVGILLLFALTFFTAGASSLSFTTNQQA